MLFLALLGGFPLDAVRYGYGLFDRLSSVYFSLNVLAKRGFTCRFAQRHDYFFLPIGVGLNETVVRVTCCALGAFGIAVLAAGRPPLGFVVPSRAMIFSAAALRAGSRLAIAARSEATVPGLYRLRVYLLAGIYLPFLAVLALSLNALAVGAPLAPGLRIFSPDPAAIRSFLAWMLAYKPFFMSISTFLSWL